MTEAEGGRGSGGVVRLWEVILRDESWGHSFIAVLIERGTPGVPLAELLSEAARL